MVYRRLFVGMSLAVALTVFPSSAFAVLITFESDSAGAKPNGFVSADSPLVSFTDSSGADLRVGNFIHQTGFTQGLIVQPDDNSHLIMNFGVVSDFLSLQFGNDDPLFSNPGDQAVLTIFLGAAIVGQATVVMNRNDIMDQSISIGGILFDSATFRYTTPRGLIEAVDNIEFTPAAVVPEPGTITLLGFGLVAGARAWRRRRSA